MITDQAAGEQCTTVLPVLGFPERAQSASGRLHFKQMSFSFSLCKLNNMDLRDASASKNTNIYLQKTHVSDPGT